MPQFEDDAFELGFDLYRHKSVIPPSATSRLIDGWMAAREQFGAYQKIPDKYVRKWLQLRVNALARGKNFDARIKPAYIERIENQQCPVTLTPLTSGELSDDDWSVDRAVNDYGYVPGNLLVMSVKANASKADKPFEEIALLATTDTLYKHRDSTVDGLTQNEWCRMHLAALPAATIAESGIPLRYLTGQSWIPGQPYDYPASLQALLTILAQPLLANTDSEQYAEARETYTAVFGLIESRGVPKAGRRALKLMALDLSRRAKKGLDWGYWGYNKPNRLFKDMWRSIGKDARAYVREDLVDPLVYLEKTG